MFQGQQLVRLCSVKDKLPSGSHQDTSLLFAEDTHPVLVRLLWSGWLADETQKFGLGEVMSLAFMSSPNPCQPESRSPNFPQQPLMPYAPGAFTGRLFSLPLAFSLRFSSSSRFSFSLFFTVYKINCSISSNWHECFSTVFPFSGEPLAVVSLGPWDYPQACALPCSVAALPLCTLYSSPHSSSLTFNCE